MASHMYRQMPERARRMVLQGDFKGCNLVLLNSEVHRPTFKDYPKVLGLRPVESGAFLSHRSFRFVLGAS